MRTAVWPLLLLACVAALSFTPLKPESKPDPGFPFNSDTIPAITEFETGRLDAALNYIDEQIRVQSGALRNINTDIRRQVADALSKADLAKIQATTAAAIKKINFEQINKDIETAMAGIDKLKMERELSCAMESVKNIDPEQLKQAINAALKDIRLNQLKGQLEAAGRDLKIQQQQLNAEMRQIKPGIPDELIKTRGQLQQLKDAYQEMERDGLIDKGPGNRIQFINGELYINGAKQSPETSEKYRHYFLKRKITSGRIVAV